MVTYLSEFRRTSNQILAASNLKMAVPYEADNY